VDLDYKGLANCGCWWVGTLQAARDRERLADGLTTASGGGAALALLDKTKKRVFVLHDIHRPEPLLVETRWAMSYLRGPMTKEEIAKLKPGLAVAAPAAAPASEPEAGAPLVPRPWTAKWADLKGGEIARAHLAVRYAVRYKQGSASSPEVKATRLWALEAAAPAEVLESEPIEAQELAEAPPRALRYEPLPAWLGPAGIREAEKALRERLPDRLAAKLFLDPPTGKLSLPGEDAEGFAARIASEAPLSASLTAKLEKKRLELAAAQEQESQRERETWTSGAMAAVDILGGLLGRRKTLRTGKVGSVLSKKRMESSAESKVEILKAEVAALEAQAGKPDPARFQEVDVVPAKANVDLLAIGVAWVS
jgi:hypothetical protein